MPAYRSIRLLLNLRQEDIHALRDMECTTTSQAMEWVARRIVERAEQIRQKDQDVILTGNFSLDVEYCIQGLGSEESAEAPQERRVPRMRLLMEDE